MGRITKTAKAMIMRWNGPSIRISAQAVMSPSTTLKRYVRQYMNHDTFTDSTYVRSFIIPSASRSLLLRHNLILDLVVCHLKHNLFDGHGVVFGTLVAHLSFGFHSRASRCASAILAGGMCP